MTFMSAADVMAQRAVSSSNASVLGKRKAAKDSGAVIDPLATPEMNNLFDRLLGIDKVWAHEGEGRPVNGKKKGKQKDSKQKSASVDNQHLESDAGSDSNVQIVDEPVIVSRPGHAPLKSEWAFSHFDGPTVRKSPELKCLWCLQCNHCSAIHTSEHMKGCTDYEQEKIKPNTNDKSEPEAVTATTSKLQRKLTAIDKIHAISIDILRSGPQRKKMQRLVNADMVEYNACRNRMSFEAASIILSPFKFVTLSLSRKDIPTICLVIPVYKLMDLHIQESVNKYQDHQTICFVLKIAAKKLDPYITKTTHSKYLLLSVVLHPMMRLSYFKDPAKKWNAEVKIHARQFLDEIYAEYAAKSGAADAALSAGSARASNRSHSNLIASAMSMSRPPAVKAIEIELYLSHAYPINNSDGALRCWADENRQFPVLREIARDILTIPGSSMTAENASMTIITKE
ncbi:hypothetical protein NM688_g2679 [Phlebia brevispora]|uniref:Uncharacterized protein n=1 Tax=Phlebia brevispora TaxID=194682 RepID=A0ACC1T860_9APHY|nr:hypothetical protein NM688_g2679 [Phlebia brevispora]